MRPARLKPAIDHRRALTDAEHMAVTTPRPLTKFDYWQLPETGRRYQLINGDLYMAPAPNRFHQDISRTIEFEILKYLEREPKGIIYDAPFDVVLTDLNVFQPDLAFFSRERRDVLTEKGAEGAPDLVIEILSASTARLDLDQKRIVYARTGVSELWIVNPDTLEIQVFDLRVDPDLPAATLRQNDLLRSRFLPGFELPVSAVFQRF
jgi:Uma2 family endonuclease